MRFASFHPNNAGTRLTQSPLSGIVPRFGFAVVVFVAGALSDGGVTAELRDDGVARGLSLLTRRSVTHVFITGQLLRSYAETHDLGIVALNRIETTC